MRVLMIVWDFEPHDLSGGGRRTAALARALAAAGDEVVILTREAAGRPALEHVAPNVDLVRVGEEPPRMPPGEALGWTLAYGLSMLGGGVSVLRDRHVDVIYAADLQSTYPAASLARIFDVPVVAAVASTRHGAGGDLAPGRAVQEHQIEWWLTYVARRVVVTEPALAAELVRIFELPADKVDVIAPPALPRRPVVLLAAGWVYRDDATTAAEAIVHLARRHPRLSVRAAGLGGAADDVAAVLAAAGLAERVEFCDLGAALASPVSVAVIPSVSDPYDAIVNELLAARVPLVCGETDDMRRLVAGLPAGANVVPQDPDALAAALGRLLPGRAVEVDASASPTAQRAQARGWDSVAHRVQGVFAQAIEAHAELDPTLRHGEEMPLRLIWDSSAAYQLATDRAADRSPAGARRRH